MSNTKIFVCCHGPSQLPEEYFSDPYVLVGAGGYKSDIVKISDNVGDNISEFNRYLNEMTVMYWIARNYDRLPDFVGFAMYRHHLACSPYSGEAGKIVCVERNLRCVVGDHFVRYHGKEPLSRMVEELGKILPHRQEQFVEYIKTSNKLYKGNMFIMPKDVFFDYFGFIQYCIDIAKRLVVELDVEHSSVIRSCGFLLEHMTSFWIWQYVREGRASLTGVRTLHFDVARLPLSSTVNK